MVELLQAARRASARTVNAIMTATYWEIGRRIVQLEQRGRHRADYGKHLLERLSADLTSRCGRGFGLIQIRVMRQFFLAYPAIRQSAIDELSPCSITPQIPKSVIGKFESSHPAETLQWPILESRPTAAPPGIRQSGIDESGPPDCPAEIILPSEELLAAEIAKARERLERRKLGAR
jgi:hypothetical protein